MTFLLYVIVYGVVKEEETIKKRITNTRESIHPKIFIKQTQTIDEGGRLYFDVPKEQKNEKNTYFHLLALEEASGHLLTLHLLEIIEGTEIAE